MDRRRVREGFGRAMRLTRSGDIKRVFQSGLSTSNAFVTIRARRGGARLPRLALAVARKHVTSAVKRNQIKRIARESFRRNAPQLRGLDVVIVSRPEIAGADRLALRNAIDAEWEKLLRHPRLAGQRRT